MKYNDFFLNRSVTLLACLLVLFSCSKESNPGPSADVCAGKTIAITASATASSPCGNTGSINVSATGSSGFMYKLNSSGTYQSAGNFSGIAAGTYTIFAKDAEGCEKSKPVTISSAGSPGPLFTAVKNLISSKCQSCHNVSSQSGGLNLADQCNIIQFQSRIKVRAVDQGNMPQGGPELTTSQKAVITNWINAGGRFQD